MRGFFDALVNKRILIREFTNHQSRTFAPARRGRSPREEVRMVRDDGGRMYGVEAAGSQFGVDWNGDHTFSQSAADYSLQEYIEPEVAQKNPQLSPTDIHIEATRIFALRSAQDQLFDQKEARREEDMVTKWEVVDIDGKKQLATQYGDRYVSLEELWRHTEEFALRVGKPDAFSRAEMQTQLAIQDALIAGRATSVAFTLSHPESVRYVQQWQRGTDGVFYSTQIDIGKHAGRDLRHDEVKGFLDQFRDQHRDTAIDVEGAAAGSYVAVRGSMEIAAISKTAKLHAMTTGEELFARRFPSPEYVSRRDFDASDRAYPLWVIADRRWFSENKREKPPVFDRIGDKEKKDIPHQTKLNYQQEKLSFTPMMPVRQEGSSDGKIIRKEYDVRRTTGNSIQIVTETGVAVHAVPALLARLAEKVPTPVQAIEKSIRRHEERELRIKNKELRRVAIREVKKDSVKVQPLRPEGVEPLRAAKERKGRKKRAKVSMEIPTGSHMYTLGERGVRKDRGRGKRSRENGVKIVAAASEIIPSASEKRGRREKPRLRRAVEKSMRRRRKKELRMKNYELRRIVKQETKKDLKERKRSIQRKEREAVAGVVFGWMVWMILNRANLLPVGSKLATFSEEQKILDPRLRGDDKKGGGDDKKGGGDDKEVSTPWVLLSIIWYLTAIREQGTQNTTNTTNTTNNQIKTRRTGLPQRAIIFSFAS